MKKESIVRAMAGVPEETYGEINLLEKDGKHFLTLDDAGIDLYTAMKEDLEFVVFEKDKNRPYVCLEDATKWSETRSKSIRRSLLLELGRRIRDGNFVQEGA